MSDAGENRAVSALFRVFGGAGGRAPADAFVETPHRAMHIAECAILAALVPLSVFVALAEGFCRWIGPYLGIPLALPAAFLLLTCSLLCLTLKRPRSQWRAWLAILSIWGWFRHDAGGIVGAFAWLWLGILVLNLFACLLLLIKWSMRLGGRPGTVWRLVLLVGAHLMALWSGLVWGWVFSVVCGMIVAAGFCWTVLNPASQWLGPVRTKGRANEILITIDDGPDPKDTPALLDLLDRYRTKAVFFMIGDKVAAHPELAREVLRRGHEIGNHTMTHPQASFWCAGPLRTWREISRCQQVIVEATGFAPRWFRAPVGHRNWFTHSAAARLGLEVVGWTRRGRDAVEKDVSVVLGRILPELENGDIVLVHEATPIAEPVLRGVLDGIRARLHRS